MEEVADRFKGETLRENFCSSLDTDSVKGAQMFLSTTAKNSVKSEARDA